MPRSRRWNRAPISELQPRRNAPRSGRSHRMTAAAETKTPVQIRVPAREAAIAWLNAFLATSGDSERPLLYRTISVEVFEFYPKGVQFIATNGHILFRAWVPER